MHVQITDGVYVFVVLLVRIELVRGAMQQVERSRVLAWLGVLVAAVDPVEDRRDVRGRNL
jgi:hypothetical protein